MNVREALSHRIGPLPAGAWIVALVGGIGVAMVIRRQAGNDQSYADGYATGEQAGYDSVAGDSTDGPQPYESGSSSYTNPGAGNIYTPDNVPTGPIKTNAQWRHRAAVVLSRRGYRTAMVEATLGRYFAGKRLSSAQQNIVDEAIAMLGKPPKPPKRNDTHKPPKRKPHTPSGPRRDVLQTGR